MIGGYDRSRGNSAQRNGYGGDMGSNGTKGAEGAGATAGGQPMANNSSGDFTSVMNANGVQTTNAGYSNHGGGH